MATLLNGHLKLQTGEAVLDVGCGRGELLRLLREAVGPDGRVVGVDYSPGMVQRARARVDNEGWRNVEVYRGDACQPAFGHPAINRQGFDAAVSTFAISAMPDVMAAVHNVHAVLRPGGRFFVMDIRLAPEGWRRIPAWFLGLCYRALAGWTGQDVLSALRQTFRTVELVKAGGGLVPDGGAGPGWGFIAIATA
jgi:ubiquinone/menaquinone biosynthesis C-methylase UbiE